MLKINEQNKMQMSEQGGILNIENIYASTRSFLNNYKVLFGAICASNLKD